MKEIILYGELGERFGKRHRFAVKTAAEALRALKANLRGFEQYMCQAHTKGVGFRMFVGGSKVRDYIEVHNPAGAAKVIRLVPVITGSKSGFFSLLLGVVLIGAAIITGPIGLGVLPGFIASAAGSLGLSLVIGGISQLLASPPPGRDESLNRTSHLFNGPVNTTLQGKAVPVCYGRLIIGSAIISAGIQTYEAPA